MENEIFVFYHKGQNKIYYLKTYYNFSSRTYYARLCSSLDRLLNGELTGIFVEQAINCFYPYNKLRALLIPHSERESRPWPVANLEGFKEQLSILNKIASGEIV